MRRGRVRPERREVCIAPLNRRHGGRLRSTVHQFQENQLETIQKRSLRCLYGYQKSYSELLQESGIPPIENKKRLGNKEVCCEDARKCSLCPLVPSKY